MRFWFTSGILKDVVKNMYKILHCLFIIVVQAGAL
jgi:hypothetical protein